MREEYKQWSTRANPFLVWKCWVIHQGLSVQHIKRSRRWHPPTDQWFIDDICADIHECLMTAEFWTVNLTSCMQMRSHVTSPVNQWWYQMVISLARRNKMRQLLETGWEMFLTFDWKSDHSLNHYWDVFWNFWDIWIMIIVFCRADV